MSAEGFFGSVILGSAIVLGFVGWRACRLRSRILATTVEHECKAVDRAHVVLCGEP